MLVTDQNVDEILKFFETQKVFVVDIESTGLDLYDNDKLIGVGVATSNKNLFYFPFRHTEKSIDLSYLKRLVVILSGAIRLIGFNIKFDLRGLAIEGLVVEQQECVDVIVKGRLCSREKHPDLDLVSVYCRFVNRERVSNKEWLKEYKKKNKIKENQDVDPEIMGEYCCEDLRHTYELDIVLSRTIKETKQERTFQLELETTKTLFLMEHIGTPVDPVYCLRTYEELNQKIEEVEQKSFSITKEKCAEPVNMLSNKQLGEAFHAFGVHSPVLTGAGAECWDEKALLQLDHPLVGVIKEYRTLRKLRDTYFFPFIGKTSIHSTFKNWRTVTGRLSSADPNLQNIPRFQKSLTEDDREMDEEKRKKILAMASLRKTTSGLTAGGSSLSSWGFTGDEEYNEDADLVSVRRLFIAHPGYVLYSWDYSQMEMRVFISYFQNLNDSGGIYEAMMTDGFDFHSFVAKLVFGYSEESKDFKFWRQVSKAISFGLIYGMGDDLLAAQMGKPVEEAAKFREIYFDRLTGARSFIESVHKRIRDKGFVYNRYGRRYYVSSGKAYVGVNYLVQGTSGDLTKDRMNEVSKYLRGKKSRLVNQIHDEVVGEIALDEEAEVVPEIVKILESNPFKIPLRVDVARCYPSWAHKKE
jgi:DNA polymerase I